MTACILIASKDGLATIRETVENCVAQDVDVYVVSDGSTDQTAELARRAGATVLDLEENVGKPRALFKAFHHFDIAGRYEHVAIVDDDTRLDASFMVESLKKFKRNVAIVCGQTRSDWRHGQRWNPWVAGRALAYWRYQVFVRQAQSALGIMTCIAGSNSVIRTDVLNMVLTENTPYLVDDTYWTLEVQRRKLGKIVYAHNAVAYVQDPTTMRAWYKQNLRWMHGTFQGIYGHRVGTKLTRFDIGYLALMFDWALYILFWPVLSVWLIATVGWAAVGWYFAGYLIWSIIGALVLRKWYLVPLFPILVLTDWIHRANMVHAVVRTFKEPTSECRWDSPARFTTMEAIR